MENQGEELSQSVHDEPASTPELAIAPSSAKGAKPKRWIWQGKPAPAFWTVACLISSNFLLVFSLCFLHISSGWCLYRIPGLKHSSAIDGGLKFAPGYSQAIFRYSLHQTA
jgi:hypothetical protein